MTRTITLPQSLTSETRALSEWGVEDFLDDSSVLADLAEQLDNAHCAAPPAVIERVLAYSASYEVKPSAIVQEGVTFFLN